MSQTWNGVDQVGPRVHVLIVSGRCLFQVASQVLESCNWNPPSSNKQRDGNAGSKESGGR